MMIWLTYYNAQNYLKFGGAFSSEEKAKAWIQSQAYGPWMWTIKCFTVDHCWCKEFE